MTGGFANRAEAGRVLAEAVEALSLCDPIVLGLPRGGVPVASEVADRLDAPLDVLIVCKVGAPRQPELGIGAVTEDGVVTVDADGAREAGAERMMDTLVARARAEVERRVNRYRVGRPFPRLGGRDVVLVDDGLATGVTAAAAIHLVRRHQPRRLVLAVPVGAPPTVVALGRLADEVVCLLTPGAFVAVGVWYRRFGQTDDEDVVELLDGADNRRKRAP